MAESESAIEAIINGKKIKATGLLALILVLTVAPIGLAFYLSSNIVEAMREQKMDFAAALITHTTVQTKKQDEMIERLDEANFIQSLTNDQRKQYTLRMPISLCKKLQHRDC